MRKLKSKLILSALFSIFLCSCLVSSLAVSAVGETEAIVFAADAILETLMNYDDYADKGLERASSNAATVLFNSVSENIGANSITIHKYVYIVGKYNMHYFDIEGKERFFAVFLTGYFEEGGNGLVDSSGTLDFVAPIEGVDGKKYLCNNLYYEIYHDDGYYKRYRFVPSGGTTIQSYMPYAESSYNFSMFVNPNRTVYDVTDGDTYGTQDTRFTTTTNNRERTFTYTSKNTIDRNSQGVLGGEPRYNSWYNWDENAEGYYPDDVSIVNSYMKVKDFGLNPPTSSGGYSTFYINPAYYVSFVDSNSSNIHQSYLNRGNDVNNNHVYNYNNTYVGGTVINNNNKTTELGGVLENNFDVDGRVIALPDVDFNANIMPVVGLAAQGVVDVVTDFYSNMPDFNVSWDTGGDNNYFDLPYQPDNGGGNVVVWDPPKYPALNTSVYIPANVPTYQTYAAQTMPSSYVEGTGDWFYFGYGLFEELGLTVFVIPLVILGLFWRFTGGD